jgi:hypothetical protein
MIYVRWTENEIKGLGASGVVTLITEISSGGVVTREAGLDEGGRVIHSSPSTKSTYGLFDNQAVSVEHLQGDLSREEFEALWASASLADEDEKR